VKSDNFEVKRNASEQLLAWKNSTDRFVNLPLYLANKMHELL
jgi:hypothetical protein